MGGDSGGPAEAVAGAVGLDHGAGGLDPAVVRRVVEEEHQRGVHDGQRVMDLAQLALLDQPPRLEALVAEIRRVIHHEGELRRGGGGGGGERARLVDTE